MQEEKRLTSDEKEEEEEEYVEEDRGVMNRVVKADFLKAVREAVA